MTNRDNETSQACEVPTLTEFLLARIAEDEGRASDAYYEGQRWAPEEEAVVSLDRDLEPVMHLDRKRDAWFAADWSPARVLAECAAKRRIVKIHEHATTSHAQWIRPGGQNFGCFNCSFDYERGDIRPDGYCETIRALATPYADHPDYRAHVPRLCAAGDERGAEMNGCGFCDEPAENCPDEEGEACCLPCSGIYAHKTAAEGSLAVSKRSAIYGPQVAGEPAASRLMRYLDYECGRWQVEPPSTPQVAAILHALADHTAIMAALDYNPDDGPWPQATSMGRWFHDTADQVARVTSTPTEGRGA